MRYGDAGSGEPAAHRAALGPHERSPDPRQPGSAASTTRHSAQTSLCFHYRSLVHPRPHWREQVRVPAVVFLPVNYNFDLSPYLVPTFCNLEY